MCYVIPHLREEQRGFCFPRPSAWLTVCPVWDEKSVLQSAPAQDGDHLAFDAFHGDGTEVPAVLGVRPAVAQHVQTAPRNSVGVCQLSPGVGGKEDFPALPGPVDGHRTAVVHLNHVSGDGRYPADVPFALRLVGDDVSRGEALAHQGLRRSAEDDAQIAVLHGREHALAVILADQEAVGEDQVQDQRHRQDPQPQRPVSGAHPRAFQTPVDDVRRSVLAYIADVRHPLSFSGPLGPRMDGFLIRQPPPLTAPRAGRRSAPARQSTLFDTYRSARGSSSIPGLHPPRRRAVCGTSLV